MSSKGKQERVQELFAWPMFIDHLNPSAFSAYIVANIWE